MITVNRRSKMNIINFPDYNEHTKNRYYGLQ